MNRPTPTSLRILMGNPGHRPLPEGEPTPEPGADMPDDLSPEAAKHWPKISQQLERSGVLTQMDGMALALYCETYARWKFANDQVVKHGPVVRAPSGFPIQSPFLAIANKAHEQMVRLLLEFGMTPVSRTRVRKVDGKGKPASRLMAVLRDADRK